MKALKIFIYTNIFVALCAALLTVETFLLIGSSIHYFVVAFVFFSTIFTYNFQRHARLTTQDYLNDNSSERLKWMFFHKRDLYILMWVGFILTCITFLFFINIKLLIFLALVGAASLLYVSGIKIKGRWQFLFSLRDIPFLKIIMIAVIWGCSTVLLPFIIENKFSFPEGLYLFLQQTCFIFAITIPFDIRDLKYDKEKSLMTIPSYFGVEKALFIALLMLFIAESFAFFNFNIGFMNLDEFLAFTLSYIVAAVFILFTNEKRKELFFSGWIEGTMLIQFLIFYILK